MLNARIEKTKTGSKLVVEIDLEEPRPSASGKTMVVASTHGNVTTTAQVNGQPVVIGLNAYVRNSK